MIAGFRLRMFNSAVLTAALCAACAGTQSVPEVTHDGLKLVPGAKVERAYLKPGEDFSQYKRVALLDCFVAFNKNWKFNHPDARTRDMAKIKQVLADDFREVFTDALQKGGYPVVTEPADDVLLVRPAIINLEVTSPEMTSSVNSMSFTASAGSMTLYVELYDSISSEILARVTDERNAQHVGGVEWTTSGSNQADAKKLLKGWADLLVQKLDAVHGK